MNTSDARYNSHCHILQLNRHTLVHRLIDIKRLLRRAAVTEAVEVLLVSLHARSLSPINTQRRHGGTTVTVQDCMAAHRPTKDV